MTNGHTSLEKYTSHTLFKRVAKGLCVRGELETEQTATYWPPVPLSLAALLSHSAGLLNRGSWGPKPSAGSWLSLSRTATRTSTNWLQMWHRVISLFDTHLLPVGVATAPNSTRQRSRLYLDISDEMHLFLDSRLGLSQYVTGCRDETINYIISKCCKLVQKRKRLNTTGWAKYSTGNCARSLNLINEQMVYAQPRIHTAQKCLGFWHTNRSSNLSQTTRPRDSWQNEENQPYCGLNRSGWSQGKNERKRKER